MDIGGLDIFIDKEINLSDWLSFIASKWPKAIVEIHVEGMDIFCFEDWSAKQSVDILGVVKKNEDKLIYILKRPDHTTFVVSEKEKAKTHEIVQGFIKTYMN